MRRALHFLVACGTLALAAPGVGAAQAAAGGIYVNSLPADADVWVDGAYIGRSPLLIEGLGDGRHALTVSKAGWVSQELSVDVASGAVAMTGVQLTSAGTRPGTARTPGGYILRKLPDGAAATVDGLPASPGSKAVPIAPGIHRLTVTSAKGSVSRDFAVFPGTTTALALLDGSPGEATHATVIARCSDFLPDGSYTLSSNRFTITYNGHAVTGDIGTAAVRFDGATVSYDAAPAIIGGRLYLPVALLEKLTGKSAKSK